MAHLLRGKQAGITTDFSSKLGPDLFVLDDLCRFGISSQIAHIVYDPVQSVLAVGTKSTKFGSGQIYVFGQKRISVTFPLARSGASVRELQFCGDRLICLDTKNDLTVISLAEKKIICSYSAPGAVTAIASDPTLDYIILGLQNGDMIVYDMDRAFLAPYNVRNLWHEHNPRSRSLPIISLKFHPRDIGKILVAYPEGAVIYSFKQEEPRKFFHYEVPRGAPGGDANPATINMARSPPLTHALWHPTGTFILTGHEDSSLVIWDPKDGRIIMARTLTDVHVNQPGASAYPVDKGSFTPKAPFINIAWCANEDPDDTGIMVAGGMSVLGQTKGLSFMELGRTPNYATATWQVLTSHFENPRRQRVLPLPPGVEVVNFCLIPRKSPWFFGAQDPIAIIVLLSSGEITTLSFPSGFPISPTNQLHLSLTFVHPFVTSVSHASLERGRWLGLTETRQSGPPILTGGAEEPHHLKRFENRSIIQTAHADGTIRLWDMGHDDQLENDMVLQADVARALGRMENVLVTQISLSSASSELAVGLKSGEICIFRWSRNSQPGKEPPPAEPNKPAGLTNIIDRRDPSLVEGFHPFTLLSQQEPCTALKVSDVGFVAAGFETGTLIVIDMRGPAVIFNANVNEITQRERSGGFRRKSVSSGQHEWPVAIEFSVMTLDEDQYSSILLHVGTNRGHVITSKILPSQDGRYSVTVAGSTQCDDRVVLIHPINATSGEPAYASQSAVGNLRNGMKVDGALLVVTKAEARIFRPPTAKGAHRGWDGAFCDRAAMTHCQSYGLALVCLLGDGMAKSFTVPGLKEIASVKVDHVLDVRRFSETIITESGEIIGWTGPSEMAMLNVWGSGQKQPDSKDQIFNPNLVVPPRPTISNFQWISGSQYITPADLDVLISGPDRPPSKRMLAQARSDEVARRANARSAASSSAQGSQEGWGDYLSRQLNERTEKLGVMGNRMDTLEENSSSWADDVNKFVNKQKRNFVMGAMKSKFGF